MFERQVRKTLIKSITLLLSFILIAVLVKLFLIDDSLSTEQSYQFFQNQKYPLLYFCLAGVFATAIGLPRQAVAFLGGFMFSFWPGLIYSTAAATIGCMLCFFYSKYLARDFILKRFKRKVILIDDFVQQQPFTKTLIIRLLPVGSNLLTNLAFGLTNIQKRSFFSASFIGYLPQMAIFSLSGSGIRVDSNTQLISSLVLLLLSLLLGALLFNKYRKSAYLDDEHPIN